MTKRTKPGRVEAVVRPLRTGDIIQVGDEFLNINGQWTPVPEMCLHTRFSRDIYLPMRRPNAGALAEERSATKASLG